MSTNEFRLSVRRGPEEGQTFTLTASSVTVGRDPMAEIVISDPEVSRQHARFTRADEGYQLQDLGSTNGTFVDGKRLGGEAVALEPGAVITMGSNVTLVYEATADPMATVISPESSFDFDEPEEDSEADDALRTMIEDIDTADEPVEPVEASFDYDFEEQGLDDDLAGADDEATSLEFPPVSEPEALPVAEEDEEDEFSFDFDDAELGGSVTPGGAAPDDRTVLDMEASDVSSYGQQSREDDSLPSFEESSELPSFDEPEAAYSPPPAGGAASKTPPPPPPPSVTPSEPDSNRRRNIIIAVVALILLCCCCSLLMYFVLGDPLLELFRELGLNFQF